MYTHDDDDNDGLLTIITFCSGERDQRLAKLPEVSTSDGSIRDGVLRAE